MAINVNTTPLRSYRLRLGMGKGRSISIEYSVLIEFEFLKFSTEVTVNYYKLFRNRKVLKISIIVIC